MNTSSKARLVLLKARLTKVVEFRRSPASERDTAVMMADYNQARKTYANRGLLTGLVGGAAGGAVLGDRIANAYGSSAPGLNRLVGGTAGAMVGGALGQDIGRRIRKDKPDRRDPRTETFIKAINS